MTNLAQHLLDTAAKRGAHPALRMDDAALTYAEFRDAALRVAAACRRAGSSPATGWAWCCPTCCRSRSCSTARCSPAPPSCR